MARPSLAFTGRGLRRTGALLQWARRGRQGVELVATIRRVAQMARDWGVGMWLVKLFGNTA